MLGSKWLQLRSPPCSYLLCVREGAPRRIVTLVRNSWRKTASRAAMAQNSKVRQQAFLHSTASNIAVRVRRFSTRWCTRPHPCRITDLRRMQAGDIADYLSGLDGGADANQPVTALAPEHPTDSRRRHHTFSQERRRESVTAVATMSMGQMPMNSPQVTFKPTSDRHVYTGRISNLKWAERGPFTSSYDGKTIDRPLVVGQ